MDELEPKREPQSESDSVDELEPKREPQFESEFPTECKVEPEPDSGPSRTENEAQPQEPPANLEPVAEIPARFRKRIPPRMLPRTRTRNAKYSQNFLMKSCIYFQREVLKPTIHINIAVHCPENITKLQKL